MRKIYTFFAALFLVATASCNGKNAENSASDVAEGAGQITEEQRTESAADTLVYTVKTLPASVKGNDILPAITQQYKGEVVLIDFWATWCGPCRQAMKTIDEIKPELMKKGCKFVYVTGDTSPIESWKSMIKNIAGDHYRLNGEQWETLCTDLDIPGIPAYLLLNKDGSVAFSNLNQGGYPGNEVISNQVEVALTK